MYLIKVSLLVAVRIKFNTSDRKPVVVKTCKLYFSLTGHMGLVSDFISTRLWLMLFSILLTRFPSDDVTRVVALASAFRSTNQPTERKIERGRNPSS